jgi:hypothetical protein
MNAVQKIREEFQRLESNFEGLCLLKQAAEDFKKYRRMIKIKKYD